MKLALCGQDDCPRPYEFCEACIRADERARFHESMELAETEVRGLRADRADLRAKVEALAGVHDIWLYRDDVLALIDGSSDE